MAFPTAINDQITDAVSQTVLFNLGVAGGTATSVMQTAAVHGFALRVQGAVGAQARAEILRQAVVTAAVGDVLGRNSYPDAGAYEAVL